MPNILFYRYGFDLVLPHIAEAEVGVEVWQMTAQNLIPVHKHFLISFMGYNEKPARAELELLTELRKISKDKTDDKSFVDGNCQVDESVKTSKR